MEKIQTLGMPYLSGDFQKLYRHKKYMQEAFDIITVEDTQKGSFGFVSGLYGAKAIYDRLARMQLKERGEGELVELIVEVK